jgi:hypothetical protein
LNHLVKRKFPRFRRNCDIRYKFLDLGDMTRRSTTINISGGGLCF